jgi:hypothetical protein
VALQRFLTARRPKPDSLRAALEAVDQGARCASDVGQASGLSRVRAIAALNLLEQADAVVTDADGLLRRTDLDVVTAVEKAVGLGVGRAAAGWDLRRGVHRRHRGQGAGSGALRVIMTSACRGCRGVCG